MSRADSEHCATQDFARWLLEQKELRQPRPPKPHVMLCHRRWYLVDPPLGTWEQKEPITKDPRWVAGSER